MKLYGLLFLMLITSNTGYLEIVDNEISIDKNHKIEGTFSGSTFNNNSFHLIVAKNQETKLFEILPFHFVSGSIEKLKPISFEEAPSILSFHNTGQKLSLVTQEKHNKKEFIHVIDLDLVSGDYLKSEQAWDPKNLKTVIRKDNKSLLIFSEKDSMTVIQAFDANTFQSVTATPDKSALELLEGIDIKGLDAINNDEFVANGSIDTYRAYNSADGESIILTGENLKEATTEVVLIPLTRGETVKVSAKHYGNEGVKTKKSTSYVNNNKLYKLLLDKKEAKLVVHGLMDEEKTLLDISEIEPTTRAEGFSNVPEFLKQASKASNAPTVTTNPTKKGNFLVRLDYVLKKSYNYKYNWWWHHQQMMWQQQQMMRMQQQQMMNSMPRYGPAPVSYNDEDLFYSRKSYFEFIISPENDILSDKDEESVYADIDKKSYVETLEDNKKLKHVSSVFTDSAFRYIAYNKSTKTFKILEVDLK